MIKDLLKKLYSQTIVIFTEEDLNCFLQDADVLEEKDTFFRDKIRIIQSENIFFVQERSNKEEIIVRRIESLEEGQLFIKNRLAVYENMWNGCGCKVDYYK